jgi:hypothetical protein
MNEEDYMRVTRPLLIWNTDVWKEEKMLPTPLPVVYYEIHWKYDFDVLIDKNNGVQWLIPFGHYLFIAQVETEEDASNYTGCWCCGGVGFRIWRIERDNYTLVEENGFWRPYVKYGVTLHSHTNEHSYYYYRRTKEEGAPIIKSIESVAK